MENKPTYQPIGIFDSGFGGLTVLKEIENELPEYDFLYLGDNARAPYGSRSFETVYEYTLQCVTHLFNKGCHLVVLACNTASAKALRTIQQNDLPELAPNKRVLGVIRPTTEVIGNYTETKCVGILGTEGTVSSKSYLVEIEKFFPNINVYQQACPMLVPLIENQEFNTAGADFFIDKYVQSLMRQNQHIDAIVLGCTHYPLIADKIKQRLPDSVKLISQGKMVAKSLKNYLQRHPEIENNCSKGKTLNFYTTDLTETFDKSASLFYGKPVKSNHLDL